MDKKTYSVPYLYENLREHPFTDTMTVQVPGSKSITNRALLLATLAQGTSRLEGVLFSDDSRHFLKCIQDLGFETSVDEPGKVITVSGRGGIVPLKEASQYVGSAGTAARFLTAYLGISEGTYFMDASEQMRRRPMAPLLASLRELGCEITFQGQEGCFPFTLHGHGFGRNEITVDIGHSSQFLSALLISSCLAEEDFTIHVKGTHGMAYIDMTCRMMEQFGAEVCRIPKGIKHHDALNHDTLNHDTSDSNTLDSNALDSNISDNDTFLVRHGQAYRPGNYRIEPDASAACYFYACVPLLHIPVLVEHVHFNSLQGDVAFLAVLEQMGCTATDTEKGILVTPPEAPGFPGVATDMSACSDQAITLAAIAPFADSPTTITGIGHIRFQESDRISAIAAELAKMGIKCAETESSITIYPGSPRATLVETYDDHRMAMGFSLTGLRAPGIVIDNPGCCRKTFENYFEVLDKMVATIQKR